MKKRIIIFSTTLFLATMLLSISAQDFNETIIPTNKKVAFINTSELLEQMPEKTLAAEQLRTLNENYKAELKLMENEYNKKYSDFITYQGSMAENIKLRRMQELTELEQKMNNFMELAQKDIEEKEQEVLTPLKSKLNEAIRAVGIENNFMVIYDISNTAIVFVNPEAIDATPLVKAYMQNHK